MICTDLQILLTSLRYRFVNYFFSKIVSTVIDKSFRTWCKYWYLSFLARKSALDLPRVKVGVPYIYFDHHINQYILSTWQDDWNGAVANKLLSVKPTLADLLQAVSCVMPASVIHIYPIHTSWRKFLNLNVSTASVFWRFATFFGVQWFCSRKERYIW